MITSYKKSNRYLLLLKADEFLRDRCLGAALRVYPGPVFGMAINPAMPKLRLFDHVLQGDPHLAASALAAVKSFEQSHGMIPEAVVPVTEMSLQPALAIASHYDLPFLSADSVAKARNKDLMKEAFLGAGLPTAAYQVWSDRAGLERAIEVVGLPAIVKPCAAAHSVGVIRIDSREDIARAYEYCTSGLKTVKDAWRIEKELFQAETYFDADREVSVEVFNHGGQRRVLAITEKYLTAPPYFAEVGHMVPSRDRDTAGLKELALSACESLGLTRGIAHVEVRIDGDGRFSIVEVAARPGGDGIMDLVERAYGVNMYDLHVRSFLDRVEGMPDAPSLRGVAAIAFMQTAKGTVRAVRSELTLPLEVVSLYLTAKQGDTVGGSLNYDDRLGTVEFFWPEERANLGTRHLDLAAELAARIFEIS